MAKTTTANNNTKIIQIEKSLEKWKSNLKDTKNTDYARTIISELDEILHPAPIDVFDPNQITVYDFLEDLRMEQQEQM